MNRTFKLTVPVSKDERDMAREVSKAEGLSLADWVRQRVRGAMVFPRHREVTL